MDPFSRTSLDHTLTEFCDQDRNWWPLLSLRPNRAQPLGLLRTWALATLLGLPLGMLANILIALLTRTIGGTPPSVWFLPLLIIGLNGCALHLTLVPAWNRRARQLARVQKLRSPWT